MRKAFRTAARIYFILMIIYTIIYWPLVIIDDWSFVERYWSQNWLGYIGMWLAFYSVFLVGGSLYYWIPVSVIILLFRNYFSRNLQDEKGQELDQIDFD